MKTPNSEIKVGDKFARQVDTDSDSWIVNYTVQKVTAKTVTVTDDRFPEGSWNHEKMTRRVKQGLRGEAYIAISDYSYANHVGGK